MDVAAKFILKYFILLTVRKTWPRISKPKITHLEQRDSQIQFHLSSVSLNEKYNFKH